MNRFLLPLIVVVALAPSMAIACLWDYDTLRDERQRFPDTLELITGKFLRHSKEFYNWRIADRKKKLAVQPGSLEWMDDLAVAYEKTGDHAKAIETMQAAEKLAPNRYETLANLGTFYILAGELDKGLGYINKALAINPDAHFGRERYQKWLVEYMLGSRVGGKVVLPLQIDRSDPYFGRKNNFANYVASRTGVKELDKNNLEKAIKGVSGMMRFANYENPVLLEALGDLLLGSRDRGVDAKRMAARSYLKASYVATQAKSGYRMLAEHALKFQARVPSSKEELTLDELERDFSLELRDANDWYADVKAREIGWIREGKDADAEFDQYFRKEPVAAGVNTPDPINDFASVWISVFAVSLIAIVAFLVWRWRRRRSRNNSRSAGRRRQTISGTRSQNRD